VTFTPEGRPPVTGMLLKYNKKTVTVITEGFVWTLAVACLAETIAWVLWGALGGGRLAGVDRVRCTPAGGPGAPTKLRAVPDGRGYGWYRAHCGPYGDASGVQPL
jgi:hypothetical protein